jgi:hypothetical protein
MVDENIEFSDEDDDYGESGLSINEIILAHIRKISDLSCKEFTGSFWSKKPIKTQNGIIYTETYHEDVREAYCNAINFLIDILYPLGDKKFKDYLDTSEDIEKEETDINKKIKRKRITFKEINLMFERNNFWGSTGTYNETIQR